MPLLNYKVFSDMTSSRSFKISKVSALLILSFCLFMTVLIYIMSLFIKHEDESARFNQLSQAVVDTISSQIQSYESVLISTRALFTASNEVNRSEFRNFVASFNIQETYPGLMAIGYAEVVHGKNIAPFVQRLRKTQKKYKIWPAGDRNFYVPVTFIEPFNENRERVVGFDMFSEHNRRVALEKARDTGSPVFSESVNFVQELPGGLKTGLIMYVPVYKFGLPIATIEQRRQALQGYIYGLFDPHIVFTTVLADIRYGSSQVVFSVYEKAVKPGRNPLFTSFVPDKSAHKYYAEDKNPNLTRDFEVVMAQAPWIVRVESTPEIEIRQAQLLPWYVLTLGVIISFLIYFNLRYAGGINKKLRDELVLKEKVEKEITKAQKAAQEASQAKSQFLANVSHEIRTPLGIIIGFADLALDPNSSVDEIRKYLASIKKNGQQLASLISEVLDMSKIEANKIHVELMRFSLPQLLEELMRFLEPQALEKGIELFWEKRADTPEFITTDPTKLRQILLNLLSNAIKFTEKGSVTLSPRLISKPLVGLPMELEFLIMDTGIGIDPDQHQKLFQPFSQATASTTRKFGGTGLGLVLSQQFARCLNGDVELKSSIPKKGSTFSIRIPAGTFEGFWNEKKFQNQDVRALTNGKSVTSEKALAGTHILLVEDSQDNQVLFGRYLESAGANLAIANNGAEGLQKALTEDYDVVLMDLQMPILDGHEAATRLRQQGYKKPIVAISAFAFNEEKDRAMKEGFDGYLTKPLPKKLLIQEVKNFAGTIHSFEAQMPTT